MYHGAPMAEYRCPICKKPAESASPSFPFCSRRCKLIDLGTWASEGYRISRALKAGDLDSESFGKLPSSSPDRADEAAE